MTSDDLIVVVVSGRSVNVIECGWSCLREVEEDG